ncbi:MAG TPA: NAD(P)/FAD-dependent oxidoreductase, partial [Mycobacteriales bacterium]|nr:NAD(P)/FAD-dependent oxidoreductase [Mycobacteriales bacterium]
MTAPLVVVGASLAGLRAVEGARRAGWTGPVVLVGAEEHLPYDRPPLSKAWLAPGDEPAVPTYRDAAALSELAVELRLGTPATGLELDAREVVLGDERLPYGALVVATGAAARRLPGPAPQGVHVLRTLEDARAVRAALDAGSRTVVVGAGFIGSEVASAARARGLPVTVVEAAAVPLARACGGPAAALLTTLHARAGTDLRCGTGVSGFRAEGGRAAW